MRQSWLAFLLAGAVLSAAEPAPILKLPDGVKLEQLADPKEAVRVADVLEKSQPRPHSEGMRMLLEILRGGQMMNGTGWFGPAQSRFTWAWLAQHCGIDAKATALAKKEFKGPAALFDMLDRDGDEVLTPSDLDWSDRSPYVMQAGMYNRWFRMADRSGDGKLSKAELEEFFKRLAGEKDHFTADELRRMMIPRGPMGFAPGDGPTTPTLVKGLFAGEIGSISEGPSLNEKAPDFTLKTLDGNESIALTKSIGPKPVVLVFGNFTCGPFRALYPDVEAVYQRMKDHATFLMVYVREAHPTDGWKMAANERFGVAVKQPTTYAERVSVCAQFNKMVQPKIPIVVDAIDDPTGNAYSGMPARLYVLDRQGKVAYKSGRGPFGFKPGEMEQALTMCVLDGAKAK